MPISRLPNGKLLYFAHVPKAAGTSVERYLINRFGALGLHDPAFASRAPSDAWSLSPPQHMPEFVRQTLLPDSLFDGLFATVRHPLTRLRSAFLFQREVEKAIPSDTPFSSWIDTLPSSLAHSPYALHRHMRPMVETVPTTATVFRVEDGLNGLVTWLDQMAGSEDGPRQIGTANRLQDRLSDDIPDIPFTDTVIDKVASIYAADYERFDYAPDPPETEGTA